MFYPHLTHPVPGAPVSQFFGENPDVYKEISYNGVPLMGHNGIDFACSPGTPVMAAHSGVVIEADHDGSSVPGLGKYVKLRQYIHNQPVMETVYAHLSKIEVSVRDVIPEGRRIALSGNTGWSTGPHLHFGFRLYPHNRGDGWGGYTNPLRYLQARRFGPVMSAHLVDKIDVNVLASWRPPVVKMLESVWKDGDYLKSLYLALPDTLFLFRDWQWSSQKYGEMISDPVGYAERFADYWRQSFERISLHRPAIDRARSVFLFVNEPAIWEERDYDAFIRSSLHFTKIMAAMGYAPGNGNLSVGWPVEVDGDIIWKPMLPLVKLTRTVGGVWLNHEYGLCGDVDEVVPGRILRGETLPVEAVTRIIGEGGIDTGADPKTSGYLGCPWPDDKNAHYIKWLRRYEQVVRNDPRLLGACIYTHDQNWPSFNLENMPSDWLISLASEFANEPKPSHHTLLHEGGDVPGNDDNINEPPPNGGNVMAEFYDKNGVKLNERDARARWGSFQIQAASNRNGEVWRLLRVDETEGPAVLKVITLGPDGNPMKAVAAYSWQSGQYSAAELCKTHYRPQVELQWTEENGVTGFGIGSGSYYDPARNKGPHAVWICDSDAPSDVFDGAGMISGTNHRGPLSFVFQLMKRDDGDDEDGGGDDTPCNGCDPDLLRRIVKEEIEKAAEALPGSVADEIAERLAR